MKNKDQRHSRHFQDNVRGIFDDYATSLKEGK
jgi:hypothetical protein